MVEMKEVKPKISDRIKGFFIMHPLFFAWIIIIAVIMFNSCGKAKAEDYSDVFWSYVEEDLNTYHSLTSLSTIKSTYMSSLSDYDQTVTESISKFVRFEVSSTQNGNIDGVLYYFCLYDNAVFSLCSSLDTDLTSFNFSMGAYDSARDASLVGDNVDRRFYVLHIKNNSSVSLHNHRTQGSRQTNFTFVDVGYSTDLTSYYITGSYHTFAHLLGDSSINAYSDLTSDSIISYGDNYLADYETRVAYYGNSISWVDDSRLDIYTLYNNTGKDLVIDITKFDFSNYDGTEAATQNTLVDDEINITVSFDGTEQEFVLNSSTSKILRNYVFKTPYTFFGLDNYTDVKIINVSFSKLIHYRPNEMKEDETENYYISCEYWLKHLHEDVEPNDNPYADDVEGSVLTNSEKQALQYLVDFDHGAGLTFNQYQSLDKPDFFEEDAVFVYLSDGGTLSELLDDLANIPLLGMYADMIASFINSIDDTVELQAAIYDYLYDNTYSQTSSMIVFVYIESWTDWTAGTIDSDDLTYYYYITTYGRIRQLNQTLADMYVSTKQTENNVAAIFDEVDGFEDSFIDFYNMTIADNATARGWLSTINNSINSLEFPVFDDSDIISKLNEIKTAITGNNSSSEDEDDTIEEAIKYYNSHSIQEAAFEDKFSVWFTGKAHSWLQSKKANGEPNDPTSNRYYILTGMWDAVCNAYDYLTDESQFWYSFNAYLESLTGTYNTSGTTHTEALDEKHQYMTFFNNGFYDVNEYDGQLTIGE